MDGWLHALGSRTAEQGPARVAVAGEGLWRQRRDVAGLLQGTLTRLGRTVHGVDAIVGWGRKPTTDRARRVASSSGIQFVALEDGFIRSVKPACGPSLSFVLDDVGIYYDAGESSRLESFLLDQAWCGPSELARARNAMDLLRDLRLSKYNSTRPARADDPSGRILVLDQTLGDLSVTGAGANAATFVEMLDCALSTAGREHVAVKVHPEVAQGRKDGYLHACALQRGVTVVADPINIWDLLERFQEVYTVSSQAGFEAVIAGLRVTCFGMPFYAGWGFTEDRSRCARRTVKASVETLTAAFLFKYSRYLDPWQRRLVEFEEAAQDLAFLRDRFLENDRPVYTVGLSRWKQSIVRQFLEGPPGPPRFAFRTTSAVRQARESGGAVLVWGSALPDLAGAGVPVIRAEDGFLRSIGLGAALVPASSLIFDAQGLHYDPRRTSGFETLARNLIASESLTRRAFLLRQSIVSARLSKYNEGSRTLLPEEKERRRVLVPGQVEDDASVLLGASDVRRNLELLRRVRQRNPDAFILFKPHPDVASGYRRGHVPDREARLYANAIVSGAAMPDVIDWCDSIETMTSLAGFEGLLRHKSVVTHGRPFYAGWGLTDDLSCPSRGRNLSLDELVAVALVLYPRYVDPVSGLPCRPELVVERFRRAVAGCKGERRVMNHVAARARRLILQPLTWLRLRATGMPSPSGCDREFQEPKAG